MTNAPKVVNLYRPKSLTSAEKLIEEVRIGILRMNVPRREMADKCGIHQTTIGNLASGKTRWPRPTTLFPIIHALGMELKLQKRSK